MATNMATNRKNLTRATAGVGGGHGLSLFISENLKNLL